MIEIISATWSELLAKRVNIRTQKISNGMIILCSLYSKSTYFLFIVIGVPEQALGCFPLHLRISCKR